MKKLLLTLTVLLTAIFTYAQTKTQAETQAPAQQESTNPNLTDAELYNAIWAMGQMYPDGFTIDINTMRQPTEGLVVSYIATQNSFDRKSIPAVVKHAREHQGFVGGWYNPENKKYYFDSNRIFPEDSLAAAVQFARDNGQHTVYIASKGINIWTNYEQKDIRIILDCDMGSSTDDLFALMMLYRYMDMKRCNLIGVIVDRMGRANADIVDVMNNFYGYPDIPIGLETKGIENPHVFITYHNLPYARSRDGVPMFKRTVGDIGTYHEAYKLYRKLLAESPDKSVTIASIGFVTSLSRLLQSGPDEYSPLTGVELVRQKVKELYAMGGVFGDAVEPDYNFKAAINFSLKFFELWPKDVDIVFSPGEVGDPLDYRPETGTLRPSSTPLKAMPSTNCPHAASSPSPLTEKPFSKQTLTATAATNTLATKPGATWFSSISAQWPSNTKTQNHETHNTVILGDNPHLIRLLSEYNPSPNRNPL